MGERMPSIQDPVSGQEQDFRSWDHIRIRIEGRKLTADFRVREDASRAWTPITDHPETRETIMRVWDIKPASSAVPNNTPSETTSKSPNFIVKYDFSQVDNPSDKVKPSGSEAPGVTVGKPSIGVPHTAKRAPSGQPDGAPKPTPVREKPTATKPQDTPPPPPPIQPAKPPQQPTKGPVKPPYSWAPALRVLGGVLVLGAILSIALTNQKDDTITLSDEIPAGPAEEETRESGAYVVMDPVTYPVMQVTSACSSVRVRKSPSTAGEVHRASDGREYMLAPGYGVKSRERVEDAEAGPSRSWIRIIWPVDGYVAERGFSACSGGYLVPASIEMQTAVTDRRVIGMSTVSDLQLRVTEEGARIRALPTLQEDLGTQITGSGPEWTDAGLLRPDTIVTPIGEVTGLRGEAIEGKWYRINSPARGFVSATTVEPVLPEAPTLPETANGFAAPAFLNAQDLRSWDTLAISEYRDARLSDNLSIQDLSVRAIPSPYGRLIGRIGAGQTITISKLAWVDNQLWCQTESPLKGFVACMANAVAAPPPKPETSTPALPAPAPPTASGPPPVPMPQSHRMDPFPSSAPTPRSGAQAPAPIPLLNEDIARQPDEWTSSKIFSEHIPSRHRGKSATVTVRCSINGNRYLSECVVVSLSPDLPGFRESATEVAEKFRVTASAQRRAGFSKVEFSFNLET